ncbi:hypothetical protein EYB25_002143 [Talaromyces marneffei]|nr:hypothetical protein EYB25_002143 [Talaromyces marneffei]
MNITITITPFDYDCAFTYMVSGLIYGPCYPEYIENQHYYTDIMLTNDLPSNFPGIDHNHLQGLEERFLSLDRKLLKHHDRLLEKTDRLVTTTNHIYDEIQTLTRTLNNQTSIVNNTRHIVLAQARTISAQARKIRSQQEMIDVMQRDIFRLGRWYTESLGRVNVHEEMLSDRQDEVRKLWQALERHTAVSEQIERETYWMHVYTKQVMMLRAAEMDIVGTSAAADDDEVKGNDEEGDSNTAGSVCTESTFVTPFQPHILLDKIVVHMIRDLLPDRLEKICDGFEVVHESSAFIHGKDNAQASEDGSDEEEMLREDSDDDSM